MNESSKMPGNSKAARKEAERRRLAAALRENLKRRKAQARARRADGVDGEPSPATHDSAGFAGDKQNH